MGGETQTPDISPPRGPLDPADLQDFLDELRQAGYNIGVTEYITAQDLVLALTAQGAEFTNPFRLKSLLGPLLCSTPQEQEDFNLRYEAWINRVNRTPPPPKQLTHPVIQLDKELKSVHRRSIRWSILLVSLVTGLIVVSVIIGFMIDRFRPVRPPIRTIEVSTITPIPTTFSTEVPKTTQTSARSTEEQKPTEPPTNTVTSIMPTTTPGSTPTRPTIKSQLPPPPVMGFLDHIFDILPWLILPTGLFLIWLARRLWWNRQARLFLERRPASQSPELVGIQVSAGTEALFPTLIFLRLAQGFRQRVEAPSSELDIMTTIDKTVGRGGWFTPAFRTHHVTAEYLVLIDRKHPADQQARFVSEMVARLREHQVFIEAYYFDSDPRLCFPLNGDPPRSLWEIISHHAKHRLIIFSDAAGFFNQRTGKLETWITLFEPFQQRAIFTPEPKGLWGSHEQALDELFDLLPSTPEGLAGFVKRLQGAEGKPALESVPSSPLPDDLRTRHRRWVGRDSPPDDEVDAMLDGLQRYLDPSGYKWLCACAIYPELHWELTVYLGDNLLDASGNKLLQPRRLVDLARLPWLRANYIPDWLRLRLINSLPSQEEKEIRGVIEALLITAIQGNPGGLELEVARQHDQPVHRLLGPLLRRFARQASDGSALQDFTFMNFIAGKKPNNLAVQAPEALRQLLKPSNWRALVAPGAFATSYAPTTLGRVNWRLFGWWLLANFLSGLVPFGILYLASSYSSTETFAIFLIVFFFILLTALIPVFQWWVLRQSLKISRLWILFSLPMIYILNDITLGFSNWTILLIAAIIGVVMGVLEWFLLGSKVSRSWVWIPATILGCLAAVYTNVIGYTLITGFTLVWLERRKLSPPSGSLAGITGKAAAAVSAKPAQHPVQQPIPSSARKATGTVSITAQQPASWYVTWIAVNIVASIVMGLICAKIVPGLTSDPYSNIIAGGLFGAALGATQWLMLRRFQISPWYILASATGLGIGLWIGAYLIWNSSGNSAGLYLMFRGLVIGLPLASMQWLVLRRKIPHAYIWLIAMTIAWIAGENIASIFFMLTSIQKTYESMVSALNLGVLQVWLGIILMCSGTIAALSTAAALRFPDQIDASIADLGRLMRERTFYILLFISVLIGFGYWLAYPSIKSNPVMMMMPVATFASLMAYGFFQKRWVAFSLYLISSLIVVLIVIPLRTASFQLSTYTQHSYWVYFITAFTIEITLALQERIRSKNRYLEIGLRILAIAGGLLLVPLSYLLISIILQPKLLQLIYQTQFKYLLWYLAAPLFYLAGAGLRRLLPGIAGTGPGISATQKGIPASAAQAKQAATPAGALSRSWYALWIGGNIAAGCLGGLIVGLIIQNSAPTWLQISSLFVAISLPILVQWLLLRSFGIGPAWILNSLFGIGAGIGILAILESTVGLTTSSTTVSGIMLGIAIGVPLAISQWFQLRSRFQRSYLWIVAVSVSWFIGLFIGYQISNAQSDVLIGVIIIGLPCTLSSIATALTWRTMFTATGGSSVPAQTSGILLPKTAWNRFSHGIVTLLGNRTIQISLFASFLAGIILWVLSSLLNSNYVYYFGISFLAVVVITTLRNQAWGVFVTGLTFSITLLSLEIISGTIILTYRAVLWTAILPTIAELLRYVLEKFNIKNKTLDFGLTALFAIIFGGLLAASMPLLITPIATPMPTLSVTAAPTVTSTEPTILATDASASEQTPTPPLTPTIEPTLSVSIELVGHSGAVTSVEFSPNGSQVLTAGIDGSARLWDSATGSEQITLLGHKDRINDASFSPDGQMVLTASDDGTAILWDAVKGAEIAVLSGHNGTVFSASFSPDGLMVVTAGADGTARLWDAAKGAEFATLSGHDATVLSASFSPDGQMVVTAGADGTARLWDTAKGAEIAVLSGHYATVYGASFSPDGQSVLTAGVDGSAQLWDVAKAVEISVLRSGSGLVISASFSPDGRTVLTAESDGAARLWDVSSGTAIAAMSGGSSPLTIAIFSPDGSQVLTASSDGIAVLWDTASGQALTTLNGHSDAITSAAFSPDGNFAVTGSNDATARLWDIASLILVAQSTPTAP